MASKDATALIAKEFVTVKIDADRGVNVKDLELRLIGKDPQGSLPWFAFLAADGKCLVNSIDPDGGNIGHPAEPDEVAHFKSMLQTVKKHLTNDEINLLIQLLEAFKKAKGIQPSSTH
jgi:hypothetical protein